MSQQTFLTGEYQRAIDNRHRVTLPPELVSSIANEESQTIVAKERYGCLSLWLPESWQQHVSSGMTVLQQKLETGRLQQRWPDVQRLGRLLSTRHLEVQLGNRSRLLIPETFRTFLGVQAGGDVVVVGAGVCVEVWNPEAWLTLLKQDMPEFDDLFRTLAD